MPILKNTMTLGYDTHMSDVIKTCTQTGREFDIALLAKKPGLASVASKCSLAHDERTHTHKN